MLEIRNDIPMIWLFVMFFNVLNIYLCYKLWWKPKRNKIKQTLMGDRDLLSATWIEKQYLNSMIVNAFVLIPNCRIDTV
jgi:hypothetical protein